MVLAVVGRPRDEALGAAIREYESRAARYWPLDVVEVKEERGSARQSPDLVKLHEGERLLERVAGIPVVVSCEVDGLTMTSPQFADWLRERRERAQDMTIVIGGAHGLSDAVRERATMHLSLAPWTLPHELARLVLAEQLYRAGTILRGEPYHK
jgi:23S rRNA (pseudouridine1915-N3)-methyltransferase